MRGRVRTTSTSLANHFLPISNHLFYRFFRLRSTHARIQLTGIFRNCTAPECTTATFTLTILWTRIRDLFGYDSTTIYIIVGLQIHMSERCLLQFLLQQKSRHFCLTLESVSLTCCDETKVKTVVLS